MRSASGVLLPVAFLLCGSSASAATIKFCISHTGSYVDNGEAGVGLGGPEDFWIGDGAKLARGAYFEVYKNIDGDPELERISYGFLGDGISTGDTACTGNITVTAVNGTYDVHVSSYGEVNSTDIYVYDDQNPGSLWGATGTFVITNGQSVQNVTISVSAGAGYDVLNVYQAAAYALYRHNGGTGGSTYNYYVGPNASGYISLNDWHSERKFIIVHETGHRMAEIRTNGVMNAAQNYGVNVSDCPKEPSPNTGHSMRSEEYVGAAAGEGFAHFYAADVWNDDDETDCWFEYYKGVNGDPDPDPAVNCEQAIDQNDPFGNARFETVCLDAGYEDRGVELDWLRAFWDVHTNGSAPDPSFFDIMDWLDGAAAEGNWTKDTAYVEIDEEANELNDELETNWNNVRSALDGL